MSTTTTSADFTHSPKPRPNAGAAVRASRAPKAELISAGVPIYARKPIKHRSSYAWAVIPALAVAVAAGAVVLTAHHTAQQVSSASADHQTVTAPNANTGSAATQTPVAQAKPAVDQASSAPSAAAPVEDVTPRVKTPAPAARSLKTRATSSKAASESTPSSATTTATSTSAAPATSDTSQTVAPSTTITPAAPMTPPTTATPDPVTPAPDATPAPAAQP